jgi:hypothetical protein
MVICTRARGAVFLPALRIYVLVSAGTTGEHGEAQRAIACGWLLLARACEAHRGKSRLGQGKMTSFLVSGWGIIMHALRVLAVFFCDFATADSILPQKNL